MTSEQHIKRGKALASLLGLKPLKRNTHELLVFYTSFGSKTYEGLSRSIKRIIDDPDLIILEDL